MSDRERHLIGWLLISFLAFVWIACNIWEAWTDEEA